MKRDLMKKDIGILILVLSAIFGFIFPGVAKWIMLGLVLVGLWSWWKQ